MMVTDYESLCVEACKYAVGVMISKGSPGAILTSNNGTKQQVGWDEVMRWLNKEQKCLLRIEDNTKTHIIK